MDMRIEIEGDSEEAIALALLQMIMRAEGREEGTGREWILATYRRCLAVVRGEDDEEEDDDEEEEEEDEDELDEDVEEEGDEEEEPRRGSQ